MKDYKQNKSYGRNRGAFLPDGRWISFMNPFGRHIWNCNICRGKFGLKEIINKEEMDEMKKEKIVGKTRYKEWRDGSKKVFISKRDEDRGLGLPPKSSIIEFGKRVKIGI